MGWLHRRFSRSEDAPTATDASEATTIDGAADDGGGRGSAAATSGVVDDPADLRPSQEIRRRQRALLERYVTLVRTR